MKIVFTKLHGNGNDFIMIDEMNSYIISEEMKSKFAIEFCHRRFGIGADGVLFISKSEKADVKMRLFQPDGSEASMCGNGMRCFSKYAYDKRHVSSKTFSIETLSGILIVQVEHGPDGEFTSTIEINSPTYEASSIPAIGTGDFIEEIFGMTVYGVYVGVPHAVIFVDDVKSIDIIANGSKIRNCPVFPLGINVNFVQIINPSTISIRTYERGVEAETLSCGTGSVASALIGAKIGKLNGEVIHADTIGGPLEITIGKSIKLTGQAKTVFVGEIENY